ncbi:hypothetical protein ACFPK5_10050 [Streptomyces beijiangensis]
MADGNGMKVDLSAMDEVISKLRGLLNDMEQANGKAKYETNISINAFGNDHFKESNDLHAAHEKMKTKIENVILGLHKLVDEFGSNTSKIRDKYTDQEGHLKQAYNGSDGGKSSAPPAKGGALAE